MMSKLRFLLSVSCTLFLCAATASAGNVPESAFNKDPWPMVKEGPVKVFILSGQSNMQGHAALRTLEHLIYNEETAEEYQQWKDRDGRWTERRDVWVWTTDGKRYGNLKPGFGVNEIKMGPELGFGWVIGEHMDEQVLLIKTCWGGRSVKRDFLPPGCDLPPEEVLKEELKRLQKRNENATPEDVKKPYGKAYREMIMHVKEVLGNLKNYFPQYDEKRGYELAGFVFFQGWNDMVDGSQRANGYEQYPKRLAQLVKDVRKDLNAPDLPAVVGELGAGGKRGAFQEAQAKILEQPGLEGAVAFAKTCEFWEPDVENMVNEGVWRGPDWVDFYNVGSERGYHYLGSARIYYNIGKALAHGMIDLLKR